MHGPRCLGVGDPACPPALRPIEDGVDAGRKLIDRLAVRDIAGVQCLSGLLERFVQIKARCLIHALAERKGRVLDHLLGVRIYDRPLIGIEANLGSELLGSAVPRGRENRGHAVRNRQGTQLEIVPPRKLSRQFPWRHDIQDRIALLMKHLLHLFSQGLTLRKVVRVLLVRWFRIG